VQAKPKTGFGIWMHVFFPNHKHIDAYTHTNKKGYWKRIVHVPNKAVGKNKARARVVLRLWHGKKHKDATRYFTVLPHPKAKKPKTKAVKLPQTSSATQSSSSAGQIRI
jgi:hypothetical protein